MDEKYSSNNTMDDSHESSNGAAGVAAQVQDKVQEKVTPVANQIREAIAPTVEQGKQKTGEVVNQAKEKAVSRLDEQKAQAAGGLGSVAETLRESGQHLREKDENPLTQYAAHYTESVANQVDGVSRFLREKSVTEIVGEVEGFARREPAFFLAGAFLLGVLGARFVRSSAPGSMSSTGYNIPSGSSAIVPATGAYSSDFSSAYEGASGESTSDLGSTSDTDFGTGFESETAVNSSANNGLGRGGAS